MPAIARPRPFVVPALVLGLACASLPGVSGSAAAAQETSPAAAVRPHAGMLRYPDVSATDIVFLYAGDLWLVAREGGVARPLAGPPGEEVRPRFSPDGSTLAFMGNYDGNIDLYTMPAVGGVPLRVTHHPVAEILSDWTPDGRLLFFAAGMGTAIPRAQELFTVAANGGLPEKVPVPYGAAGAISPDGRRLVYTPHTHDGRTWKRYRGGMATDLWLYDLETLESRQLTDWEGTDTLPMWNGSDIVYLSDQGPTHRLNLWHLDLATGERRPLTTYADYDVKWPAIGPGPAGGGEVVYEHGGKLELLDLATGTIRVVDVQVPGARPALRPQLVDVGELAGRAHSSPHGRRVVLEARGDLWTVPARDGSPRNLTRSSGVAEREPAWSPDGKSIAYFADATGDYELYVRAADGSGEPRRLTEGADRYLDRPVWSPDSRAIAYWDLGHRLWIHDLAAGTSTLVDTNPWPDWPHDRAAWSPDSRWLTYTRGTDSALLGSVWIHDTRSSETRQVTAGRFNDRAPTFDRQGDYLYFVSQRDFTEPSYESVGTTFVYTSIGRIYAVPLRDDVPSPVAPLSDEEGDEESEKAGDGDGKEEGKGGDGGGKPAPVGIDFEGFEARAVLLPIPRGDLRDLAVSHEDKLVFTRHPVSGIEGRPRIEIFYPRAEKEDQRVQTVAGGVDGFTMSADGRHLLVQDEDDWYLLEPAPEQKLERPLPIAGLRTLIDPRAEWRQIFHEAWRLQRDFFYDPHMHGLDWEAVRERYAAMLEDCASREDVGYVIAEMISELNVGHAYYRAAGPGPAPQVPVGMPGVDFEVADGAYRIARLYHGAPWDADARGPLGEPALDVDEGDYLLAVNGIPLDVTRSPWAAFQGLAGQTVTLTVSDRPQLDGTARDVVVHLPGDESRLRLRAWIEANRRHVEERTGGRIGYIYVPDTGVNGQNELFRQFYGQTHLDALIIDERWNGGGQIPTRFIELLDRPYANSWAVRDGRDWPWPLDAHFGPKAMLINGMAGSGGDYFPFWFRERGLGPLIGTRTWGGLIGISGNPQLIDGGTMFTVPTFAFFEKDGTWGIEGHGVEPDIEVVDDPAQMTGGRDVQLEAAIDYLLQELDSRPFVLPQRPDYTDRSGMGVPERDR